MSLWLVTAYFPAHIAAGNFAPKRIPPNNFDFDAWRRAEPPRRCTVYGARELARKLMALAQWVITVLMDLSSAVLTSTQTTSQQ